MLACSFLHKAVPLLIVTILISLVDRASARVIGARAADSVGTTGVGIQYQGSSHGVGNDDCHIEAASKYIRAVLTHKKEDANAIPTTNDVRRDEGPPQFQVTTAFDRQSLILSSVLGPQALFGGPLYKDRQPAYAVINSTTVQANFTIVAGLLNGTVPLTTARIEEYFTFPEPQSCLISYILAIFYIGQK